MFQKKYLLFLFLLFLLFYQPISAQCNYTFTGVLTDLEDNEPLSFATVFIPSIQTGTNANENGVFLFENMCAGTYAIVIKHVLCEDVFDTIEISGNTIKDFKINHQDHLLEEIHIETQRGNYNGTASSTTIQLKQIESIRGKSLGESLKGISGVSSLQTGPSISKPVIHGLHSYRILILNNDVRQESQQWGSEHGPEIDPFIASSITVIKGAQSVQYGSDAMGGVIILKPAAFPDTVGTSGSVNLVGLSNNYGGALSSTWQGRIEKHAALAWRIQGTYQIGGNTKTPQYYLSNTAYREENFSATLHYDHRKIETEIYYSFFNTKIGIFSGSHIGNLTDLLAAFESDTPLIHQDFTYQIGMPFQSIQHHLLKTSSTIKTDHLGKFNFLFAYQNNLRSEYDAHVPLDDSLASLNLPSLYFEIGTITANTVWQLPLKKNFSSSIGIDFINQQNITRYSNFIPNFRSYSSGIYSIEKYILNKFVFESGIRYDFKWIEVYKYLNDSLNEIQYQFQNISWSLGANYSISEKCKFNIQVGSAWRAPSVSELFSAGLHHGSASLEYGDPDLKKEQSIQLQAGVLYNNETWFIDMGLYSHYIQNFIFLEPTLPPQLTIRGAFPVFYYRQTDAQLNGFDATIKYIFPVNIQAEIGTSILRARDIKNDIWIVQMPADRISGGLKYFFSTIKNTPELFVGFHTEYVFEQTRVQADEDYVPPPPGYLLFSLQTGSDLNLKNTKITWSIAGENIFNTAYRDYMNRFRYFSDDVGRNITLRIKIPFSI